MSGTAKKVKLYSNVVLIFFLTSAVYWTMILTSHGEHNEITTTFIASQTEGITTQMYSHHLESKPLFVLLVSSIGRSGSTMVSEILATRNNSVLFFEPLWYKKKDPCFMKGKCVSDYLANIANCKYEQEFEEWLIWKGLFLQYYHPKASRCFSMPKEGNGQCRRALKLRNLCEDSSIRIAKVIRSRLSWLVGLLKETSFNIKIIHLTRDPRGSLLSFRKLGWDASPSKQCFRLNSDMKHFENLYKLYPEQLFQMQLEVLSLDPHRTLSKLFTFLYGNSTLPATVMDFVEKHMNASQPTFGNMDTIKNSKEEFDAWRWKISKEVLLAIENEAACRSAIMKLNHVIFGSLENVTNRNLSLSLVPK